jgi:hypothetical protein
MPTYLFTYRVPEGAQPPADEAARAASFAAWTGWFESMGSSVVEKGNPVSDQTTVGSAANTRVGGFSLIEAPDAAAAAAFAKGCPTVQLGGGVEIGEIMAVPTAA